VYKSSRLTMSCRANSSCYRNTTCTGKVGMRSMLSGYARAGMPDGPATVSVSQDRQPETTRLLTVAEACARLRISKSALYDLIRSGRLATIRIGRRRLIPATALDVLIERLQAEDLA